ncbi:uncharacterized protein LOC112526886 [Cynara cardunculus var. scolymus]|uniref:uncharacterized protein LOC112526886 n=1 Tax=Cynara cardunculus var. scolymus TaxID=59895 RepID=UPI000D62CBFB|nr:uncharacterized protein LOC112526886 [Cynara cardunculus var. scolymus]XP_024993084.1 uncharacterized protein LOC112526886 [Cynara cardunculus var. scolymus]XP_024993085.1 uncharacterized protein LOC112526886 [Cynara cardunculus var. scolymus]XP_024993086.1 uncharacterized protein LOC112526886 [Cynara cardunculus var. scolymus]XP_024993087.1 uncharacterized protein LOC112526886 [Cynara cardunculus var. scolymus]XP_024993088.1 uncharacterized protein LOC112526886 [Cynara cardunculus var. sco
MKPNTNEMLGAQRSKKFQGQGPNWILIAGGALLSTLSVRLGYRLKQILDLKQPENTNGSLKENGKLRVRKRSGNCRSHSNLCCFEQDDGCFNCMSGTEGEAETKPQRNGQLQTGPEMVLPLVTVSAPVYNKENGVMWASSPDRLELPQKPFHHSNSSDSPCVSESGSDIFSKREVIQKLRQQLKRRDDMILEMQDQIAELQNSLSSQLSHSAHLQSQLEASNRELFDSEREIQRLRKAIADLCVAQPGPEKPHGFANGYLEVDSSMESVDRMDILKREVGELKELIEGKDYLLQNYKEQKSELQLKVKELQHRLDSQVPNIL